MLKITVNSDTTVDLIYLTGTVYVRIALVKVKPP